MALSKSAAREALVVFQRFGLGLKQGTAMDVKSKAKAALKAELNATGIAAIPNSGLPGYEMACSEGESGFSRAHAIYELEFDARLNKQLSVTVGFVERLVAFWMNHFNLSINKNAMIRATIGQLERQVVRRHVLGKFENMLLGVMQHPAMVSFLDNEESIGPKSVKGKEWGRGLNENLARETMELYTVGSGGGYTEADVTQFARVLTGWSFVRGWEADNGWNDGTPFNRGQFIFRSEWHDPGTITVMKKSYPNLGKAQGIAVLKSLARRRATAENIAFKLIRHFITDTPTEAMMKPLVDAFLTTRGDLKAVYLALIDLPEAFSAPLTKVRTPYETTVAVYRATGRRHAKDKSWPFWGGLDALRHRPNECASPQGYSDATATWLAPDSMMVRQDVANSLVRNYCADWTGSVVKLADELYGPMLGGYTRLVLSIPDQPIDALPVLFCSPEFLRR